MWARLDDELLDHQKISTAGDVIGGRNGSVIALGFYAQCLMWANRHLSDGYLPRSVVKDFRHGSNPLSIADALVQAGLLEKNGSGFVIHDFNDFNPSAKAVRDKRKQDRLRKREAAAARRDS